MADQTTPATPPYPSLEDRLARIIGAAIWRPQPCMSGDIWHRLGPLRRRDCERAAAAVMEALGHE